MGWLDCPKLPDSDRAVAIAATVVLGTTAGGCIYLLMRSNDKETVLKLTSIQQLQYYQGLSFRLPFSSRQKDTAIEAVVVPNLGLKLSTFPIGLCSLASVTQINLSGAAIQSLPVEIGNLQQLTDLDLGRNQLKCLPESIGHLTNLKYLNLMGNQLKELPFSIGHLSSLYRLGLKSNRLHSLPESLGKLTALVELFITDNCLESLPPEMGQLTALVKCQASFNERLTSLPPEMGSLPSLELLRVACCSLEEVPSSFAKLQKLAWLSLASNPMEGVKAPSIASSKLPLVSKSELQFGSKLGEGASGEVFTAVWREKQVAVKIFQAEKSPDGHSRDEMAIACALSHPNLIRMLGVLEEPLGLVMELVQGKPLAEKPNFESLLRCRWDPSCTFPLAFLLQVATGLAAALEYMHYRGVAHGDVYAHNVLADEEGKVHLCDYGASFCYKKGGHVPFEGQEVRAFGLLLNDMVSRLDVPFEGMDAVLVAQRQLLRLVRSCVSGAPAQRPCFGAVGRQLKDVKKSFAKSLGKGGSAASTPATTPRE